MAKKTNTKQKVDPKTAEIRKLKNTIKDQNNALIIGNTTIETLGKKIDQNNIDIKGYKDKIAEYKKMIDHLNKEIVKNTKKSVTSVLYTYSNELLAKNKLDEYNKTFPHRDIKMKKISDTHFEIIENI